MMKYPIAERGSAQLQEIQMSYILSAFEIQLCNIWEI